MSDALTAPGKNERIAEFCANLDFSLGIPLRRSNQGEVRRFSADGLDLAIKAPRGTGLMKWLRRRALAREFRVYQHLGGLAGFAHCYGLFEDRFLVLEYVDGENFQRHLLKDAEPFFSDLLHHIQTMHARGVAHGDLKRKSNLRIDLSGKPVILDLGTAILRQDNGGWLNHRLFDFARQTDLNAWVKLKHGGYAGVPPHDQQYLKRSRLERGLTWIRDRLRSFLGA